MIPDWMKNTDTYVPPKDGGTFAVKTIETLGGVMSRLKIQQGHEKKRAIPALLKLFILVAAILVLSLVQGSMVVLFFAAVLQLYICTWPAGDIPAILKPSFAAAAFAFVLFIPAMIMNPAGVSNNLYIVAKVFLGLEIVSIFNHTTQWNHITTALRRLHVPGIFIFTLDITLKYIVLLGNLIIDILTSLRLRSVGKNNKKYQSVGGVMGVTFLRGTEMSREMYEAMRCRGFTDDYRGL
jgi:cobalt/nickel transport system permease protein